MTNLLTKIKNKQNYLLRRIYQCIHFDSNAGVFIHPNPDLEKIGSDYGGWVIPINVLNSKSICYSFGAGEDISFDIELINRINCRINCFDPTPRAQKYVSAQIAAHKLETLHFIPEGLWHEDTTVKFFTPQNPEHVSHSITNIQNTDDFIEVPCKTLHSHMQALGHQKIDLLKMDIEGAEYAVIDDICESKLDITIICLEFHYDKNNRYLLQNAVKKLKKKSYQLVCVDQNYNYTFLRLKK